MKMSFAMPSLSFASQLALLTLQASYKAVKVVIRLSKTIKVKICCIYFSFQEINMCHIMFLL